MNQQQSNFILQIEELIGEIIIEIRIERNEDINKTSYIYFKLKNKQEFKIDYEQTPNNECYLDSIIGNLSNLLFSPLNISRVSTVIIPYKKNLSMSITVYKFATINGFVDIVYHSFPTTNLILPTLINLSYYKQNL